MPSLADSSSSNIGIQYTQKAKEVRVYYDVKSPMRSTLSVGFYSGSLTLFFTGFLFLGAGLGFLLTGWFALAGDWNLARGTTVVR